MLSDFKSEGCRCSSFKCNSQTQSFFDDLKNIQKEITSLQNDDIPDNIRQKFLFKFNEVVSNFNYSLESLELNIIMSALFNSNGQLIVDLFKKYNKDTQVMEWGNEKDLCAIFCVRKFLGYFYKLAYCLLLKGEKVELHNLHTELRVDKEKVPPLELFAEISSNHLKDVSYYNLLVF